MPCAFGTRLALVVEKLSTQKKHLHTYTARHECCMHADEETLLALLKRTSVGMQPEGIAGIFEGASPSREAVFLTRRKGFVRVAIQAGTGMCASSYTRRLST
jgi:2-acylglycerol O-acyltransferase 2